MGALVLMGRTELKGSNFEVYSNTEKPLWNPGIGMGQ